jgi:hypothetical protein
MDMVLYALTSCRIYVKHIILFMVLFIMALVVLAFYLKKIKLK